MDVHDVPSASKPVKNDTIGKGIELGCQDFYTYLRLRLPLEENMVVVSPYSTPDLTDLTFCQTVEPGIYFHQHLLAPVRASRHINHEVLARYESVGGVRIEDVVLVTSDSCENLTTVGKETSWVERVCSGELK